MKRLSKVISIFLSMLVLLSAATVFAGAANAVTVKKAIYCTNGSCAGLQQILDQCRSGKCDLSGLLKKIGGFCPDGNCSTSTPQKQQSKPVSQNKPQQSSTKPTNTQSSEFRTAYESEVVTLVNTERAKYGLKALSIDSGAVSVAHIRAKEIVRSFSHTRPDGRSCFTAAADSGLSYRMAGENIAYGYAAPAQVVKGWMNSEGHRKNILSSSFTKIGVGCYESSGVLYWSQFFIG